MWRKQQQFVAMETKSATCGAMHLLSVLPGVNLDTPRLTRHRQHLTRQKYKFEDLKTITWSYQSTLMLCLKSPPILSFTIPYITPLNSPLEGVNENE